MFRKYDWLHPLPFGDDKWVKKNDVVPLVDAVHKLLNGIYEFEKPIPEHVEAVEDALIHLQEDRNSPSTLKRICPHIEADFSYICIMCSELVEAKRN